MTLRDDIAGHLRDRICSGDLKPGEPVPSIETLRRAWGCSDGPPRLALMVLSQEGLIVSRRGATAIVQAPPEGSDGSRREPSTPPPGRGAVFRADLERVALSVPLGETRVYVELGLSRRLSDEEHTMLVELVQSLRSVVVR
jgi:DNA-binding transcriptional MocR family regulator